MTLHLCTKLITTKVVMAKKFKVNQREQGLHCMYTMRSVPLKMRNMESLFITINNGNRKINVGTVYWSPSGNEEKFFKEFNSLLEQFPKNTIYLYYHIIMGDFNFDLFKRLESAIENFEDVFYLLYPLQHILPIAKIAHAFTIS